MQIKYSGGTCANGEPASFRIKAWCDPEIAIEDTEYNATALGTDVCNPYVEITSSMGGCDLFSNSIIWEYAAYAEPYLGVVGIVGGLIFVFFGLRMIKPSLCFGGFLSCIMLSLLKTV